MTLADIIQTRIHNLSQLREEVMLRSRIDYALNVLQSILDEWETVKLATGAKEE